MISCWNPTATSWSFGRTPNPDVISSAYFAAMLSDPSGEFRRPHSPFSAGLARLQSGKKLPLVSVQLRVALLTDVFTRLFRVAMFVDSLARYLPQLPRTTVLPLPNRSK